MNRWLFAGLVGFTALIGLCLTDGGSRRATAQTGCVGCYGCGGCTGCYAPVTYYRSATCAGCYGTTYYWNYPVRRFLHQAYYSLHGGHSACSGGGCYGGCYGSCYAGCGCQGVYVREGCVGYRAATCAGCAGAASEGYATTYYVVPEANEVRAEKVVVRKVENAIKPGPVSESDTADE